MSIHRVSETRASPEQNAWETVMVQRMEGRDLLIVSRTTYGFNHANHEDVSLTVAQARGVVEALAAELGLVVAGKTT